MPLNLAQPFHHVEGLVRSAMVSTGLTPAFVLYHHYLRSFHNYRDHYQVKHNSR